MTRRADQGDVGHVAVVGGGLAGLVAALRCAEAGARVSVFEASERLGGAVRTDLCDGFLVEHGAEAFVANSRAVRELARDLNLDSEIIAQRVTRSYGFDGSSLIVLDPGEAPARLGLNARSGAGEGVATFRRGMEQLLGGLTQALRKRIEIRCNTAIDRILRAGNAWQLAGGSGPGAHFDAVIIAGTSKAAARLLGAEFGAEAQALERGHTLASVSVSLAYAESAIAHPLDGTGFVTGSGVQLENCLACTFASSKFAERAPSDCRLLRFFFRPTDQELTASLDVFRERAVRVAERVFAPIAAPIRSWEARWPMGFAVVDNEQRQRVAALEAKLLGSSIRLAGSAFHGAGIDAAVTSANTAAVALCGAR
ncbi:MAG: protoporphyrinogen/coproporphyrinogen oxidase [Myxococcota bacterium]